MSLKLGWYKAADADADDTFVHLLFVAEDAVNPSVVYQYNNQIFLEEMQRFSSHFDFVSIEKPETWVPADPSKITLDMLPMRARFRDCAEELWNEGSLMGFSKGQYFDGISNPYFEIWSYCEVVQ